MLISSRNAAPSYKAREKVETRRMEDWLKSGLTEAKDSFGPSILTRPANPMRSSASWFLFQALECGGRVADDGITIRIDMKKGNELNSIARMVWRSNGASGFFLIMASDGSAVVGRNDPEADELHFLPLALQLRRTLKTMDGMSVKQTYRTGDGWRSFQEILLATGAGAALDLLDEKEASSDLAKAWFHQIEDEIRLLFDYQGEQPLYCEDPSKFTKTRVLTGMNMFEDIPPAVMSMLCRRSQHDSHLHLGFRSFSMREQHLLERGLELAISGWLPPGAEEAFEDFDLVLIAGAPYDASPTRIEAHPSSMGSFLGTATKEERVAHLEPVRRALMPLIAQLKPSAMMHSRADIKASWSISRQPAASISNHARLEARKALQDLVAQIPDDLPQ